MEKDGGAIATKISRSEFFWLVAGGSTWLASSGFAPQVNRERELAAERERIRLLEAATISSVPIGDPEAEKEFNAQGVETSVIRSGGRSGRRARQWFSYDLPLNGQTIVTLVATYHSAQPQARSFDVIVEGHRLASESQPQSSVAKFYDEEYVIPADVLRHKEKLTVRFEATKGLEVTPVYGIRLITR